MSKGILGEGTYMRYNFEWDPAKAKRNIRKHKVTFQRATTIFRDPNAISIFDENHSENEDRWITIGLDGNGVLLIVSHTVKVANELSYEIRIISARKATKSESKQY